MSKPDTWRLISVLFSDRPLSPALAMTLYETAAQLHRDGATSKSIAGDTLTGRVTITEVRPSATRDDRGTVFTACEVLNQHGTTVMTLTARSFFRRRAA